DPTGAVVAKATVTANGGGKTYSAQSNASGDFTIPYLQPGQYQISVEAPGFRRELRKDVTVDVAQKLSLNFVLQVGAASEEITVEGDRQLLNTADASGGTVIDGAKIQNLPLNGRQVYMLMQLQPGVRFTSNIGGITGASGSRGWDVTNGYIINGVTTAYNQFTLNGAPISQQTST